MNKSFRETVKIVALCGGAILFLCAAVVSGISFAENKSPKQEKYPQAEVIIPYHNASPTVVYKHPVEGGYLYICRTTNGVSSIFVPVTK